jgi:hypothetical protein
VVPSSGPRRRGPGVQRPHRRSVRLTCGRQQGDHRRAGYLTSGHRWDDRRRTNHGRQAGHLAHGRHPGMRRRGRARQAAAAGRRLWPDRRNGARAIPRAGHHCGGHPRAGQRCGAGRPGSHRHAGCCPAGHPHAGHRCAGDRPGSHRHAGWCSAGHPHAGHPHAGHRHAGRRYGGRRSGAGRRGSHRYAGCCPAGHLHAGHRHGGHHYGGDRHGSRPYAGHPRGDQPHAGHQYAGHQYAGHQYAGHQYAGRRPGNCSPAGRRWRCGHERDGRCSRRRSHATLPGRPGRCRCGTNLACSPVSHPTGRSGPGGCRPGCLHPGCHNGRRLGPGLVRCLNLAVAGWAHRCSRHHRTGPCLHHWRVPGRCSRRDPGLRRCWNGPDCGRHPNGSGPAPRRRYGPGRPDPARLPRSCSALS